MLVVHNIRVPESEFELSFARGSGPGGQNVNKVNSKVILTWNCQASPSLPPGVKKRFLERFSNRLRSDGAIIISSDRFRDQKRNADDCREKLAAMIEEVRLAPIERRPTKPTRGSKERRLQSKSRDKAKKESRRKIDY